MATWQSVVSEVARHKVVRSGQGWLALEAHGCPVIVRAVRDRFTVWLQIDAIIGRHRDVSLESLLRYMGKETVGAVVIVGEVCLLRERVQLRLLQASHVHVVIELVIAQTVNARGIGTTREQRVDSLFDYLLA